MRRAAALVAGVAAAFVGLLPSGAAADTTALLWCGVDDSPAIDVTGLLPGEPREASVVVCNPSAAPATLRVSLSPGAGSLGALLLLSVADDSGPLWTGSLEDLGASGREIGLPAAGRRTLTVTLALSPEAGNDVANAAIDLTLTLRLLAGGGEVADSVLLPVAPGAGENPAAPDDPPEVLGEDTVAGPGPAPGEPAAERPRARSVGTLPRTGVALGGLVLLGTLSLGAGLAALGLGRRS